MTSAFTRSKPAIPSRQVFSGAPPPEAAQQSPYLTPQEALKKMEAPDGFVVDLIAAEPDIVQPIAFCWDARGRIWVVEGRTYPRRKGTARRRGGDEAADLDKPTAAQLKDIFGGEDRILIFGDEDGDGQFETRKVFAEKLNLVSRHRTRLRRRLRRRGAVSAAHSHRQRQPTSQPAIRGILLDGWGWQDTHETLNTFIWGPDGWLYGCHGVFTHSEVRVVVSRRQTVAEHARQPRATGSETGRLEGGTPTRTHAHQLRLLAVSIRCGTTFEVFAHGTSNSWGFDYNEYGDWFSRGLRHSALLAHHPGRLLPAAVNPLGHFNPYVYTNIETIADHLHYIGTTPAQRQQRQRRRRRRPRPLPGSASTTATTSRPNTAAAP